jgi:peptidoglycan/LPS O-acetylase OafA/YrhL
MLRGVAVLLVLIHHVAGYESKASPVPLLGEHITAGKSGVDLFFVISGFVMVTISGQSHSKDSKPMAFLVRRALRIYPLYWCYTFLALLIFLIFPHLSIRSDGLSTGRIAKSILLLPDQNVPIVGQGWTLIHEMNFYLTFAILLFFGSQARKIGLVFWAGAVSIFSFFWKPTLIDFSPFTIVLIQLVFSPLTLEFLAGCLIAHLIAEGIGQSKSVGIWTFFLGLLLLSMTWIPSISSMNLRREFCFGLPATLMVYGAVTLERCVGFTGPKWLRSIGDASYSIYLSHIFTLSLCIVVWKRFEKPGYFDNTFALTLMFAASIAIGILSYRHLEYPLIKIGQGLIQRGSKSPRL